MRYSQLNAYLEYLNGLGLASGTIKNQAHYLKRLLEHTGKEAREMKETELLAYLGMLKNSITRRGKRMSEGSVGVALNAVKGFFHYLYVNEHLLKDVAEDLYFPLNTREETRGVFSVEEMQDFLEVITLEGANGQRDRAIFELMYCSGLRSGELCALTLDDVDLKERMLLIRLGKGRKDRLVPFSETALSFLKLYLEVERKRVLCTVPKEDKEVFFLSPYYGRLNKNRIGKLFLKYLKDSGVEKQNRSVHSIRHSTATHLLLAGADVRFVSELLGHSEVKATVRYTHLEKENLKKAYRKAHPRENDYYEEPDEKYLSDVAKLEKALLKSRERIKKRLAKMQEDVNLNTEENF